MIFQFLNKFIKQEFDAGNFADKQFTFQKQQLYMMYVVISKLDADKFAHLDYSLNFGIPSETKNLFTDWLINGGNYEETRDEIFKQTETLHLLKLHKYFDWADKKLHTAFYIENKDQISEDLLADFKEGNTMEVKPGLVKQKTIGKQEEQKPIGMQQEDIFSIKGTIKSDAVDINSKNDFPTLGGFINSMPKQQSKPKQTVNSWDAKVFNKP